MTERVWWHRENAGALGVSFLIYSFTDVLCGRQYNRDQLRTLFLAMLCMRGEQITPVIFRTTATRYTRAIIDSVAWDS
jgi:hypothetical protein